MSVQVADEQVAVAGEVALPPSVTLTGPSVLEHAPPTEVTVPFVLCGKVTVDPFTLVSVTVGAVLSIVTDLLPEPPALPAASVCEATKAYVPSAETAVVSVSVQLPPEQAALVGAVALPSFVTLTLPSPVEHVPPTDETLAFVR